MTSEDCIAAGTVAFQCHCFSARQYYAPKYYVNPLPPNGALALYRRTVRQREVWCDVWLSMKAFISFGTFILLTVKGSTETKISHRKQYEVAPADPTEGV